MSSYTKSTDFASKDALLTGNPLKVAKGTEIDDEFNSIQTAVNSKADTNSPALSGTPTSPTAATTTSTTQIATTAFVQQEIEAIPDVDLSTLYPVGSVYLNASDSTNPGTLFGFGTWVAFGAGRVPVGIDSGDTDFDTAEETGGAKTHALTEAEMPKHYHQMRGPNSISAPQNGGVGSGGIYGGGTPDDGAYGYGTWSTGGDASSGSLSTGTGSGDAHNNMPPYIVVYMWKRTA